MMECRKIKKFLFAYAEGELSADESAIVENHLKSCSNCRRALEAIKAFLGFVEEEKKVSENPYFFTRVEAGVNVPSVRYTFKPARLAPTFIAMLLFVAGIFAGISIGKMYEAGSEPDQVFVNATRPFLDDLSQEPLEAWFMNIYPDNNDKR